MKQAILELSRQFFNMNHIVYDNNFNIFFNSLSFIIPMAEVICQPTVIVVKILGNYAFKYAS